MYPVDPRSWLVDPQVRTFERESRIDVQADNAPQVVTGVFRPWTYQVPDNKVLVVKGWVPYAQVRDNVGNVATEQVNLLPSAAFSGAGYWSLKVDGQSPLLDRGSMNKPTTSASAVNQFDEDSGHTWVSDTPRRDAWAMAFNQIMGVVVRAPATVFIQFRLLYLPSSPGVPIPARFNAPFVAGGRRVDFLGALVVGAEMASQYYDEVFNRMKNEKVPA